MLKNILLILTLLPILGASDADAQPGATPPGNTAPGPYSPPPSYGTPSPNSTTGYQPPIPANPSKTDERNGYSFGATVGLSALDSNGQTFDCFGCDQGAVGFSARLGTMLSDRARLHVEFTAGILAIEQSGQFLFRSFTGNLQYWISKRFWVSGGVGGAALDYVYDDGYQASLGEGLSFQLGLGYELLHTKSHSLDLTWISIIGNAGEDADETTSLSTLGLGFNWFSTN